MKIIVTGADGFIGSYLSRLLEIPYENQVDSKRSTDQNLINPAVADKYIEGADIVIHLAAISGLAACDKDPEIAHTYNVKATHNVVNACVKNRVRRLIFASTSAIYGETEQFVINEDHSTNPRSTYGKNKLEAEKLVINYGKNWVIFRQSNIYGFGIQNKAITVIDSFIDRYLKKEPITITGPGIQKRDFLHLVDLGRAYRQAVNLPFIRSGIYNLGSGQTISIRELAYLVNDIGESIFGYRVPYETKEGSWGAGWHDFRYDCSRARMEFQWAPSWTLDDYVKEALLSGFRKNA